MKKLMTLLTVACSLALAAPGAQAAGEDQRGMACAFGVPGFIDDQPDVLVTILMLAVPFQPGTARLAASGEGQSDVTFPVTIKSQVPAGWDRYSFVAKREGGMLMPITVSTREFKGRFAGLTPELAKQAMAATLHFPLEEGRSQDIAGFCIVKK